MVAKATSGFFCRHVCPFGVISRWVEAIYDCRIALTGTWQSHSVERFASSFSGRHHMSNSKVNLAPNRVSAALLFAVIAGAPLPFGSSSPLPISFWCALLGIGLMTASPQGFRRGHLVIFAALCTVGMGWGFVVYEQLSEHPWIAAPHSLWARAAEALGNPLEPSLSIARNQPFFALGAPIADMLALMLGLVVGCDRERAHQLLLVIAWSGAIYALYGVLSFALDPSTLLWRQKQAYLESLTATFINRNTAAAYFGSCAVVWLLLFLARVRRRLPPGQIAWADLSPHSFADVPFEVLTPFGGFLICLTAMFLTGSRAGVMLSLLALSVAFAARMHRQLPRRGGIVLMLAAGGIIAMLLLEFLGGNVNNRFNSDGVIDLGRLASYRAILQMIGDAPWFGTGLGTFPWAYAAYRSASVSVWGTWDIAHSTPLEIAAEVGIPLALVVAIGWAGVLIVLVRGVRNRKRDQMIPLAAVSVAMIAILHSTIDFSLQIPGYSIMACGLVGTGIAQSFRSQQPAPEAAGHALPAKSQRRKARSPT